MASVTRFSDRPLIITVAPSPARVEPIAKPIPAVEPVTSASLPDSCRSMIAPLTTTALCRTFVRHKPHVASPEVPMAPLAIWPKYWDYPPNLHFSPSQDLDDTQDDLPASVACLAQLMGTARFRQRQNGFDDGGEFPGIGQLCKLRQLRYIRLDEDVGLAHAMRGERTGSGMNVVNGLRLERDFRLPDNNVLGVGAIPREVRETVNLVAAFYTGDTWTCTLHNARNVPSRNQWKRWMPLS